MIDHFFHILRPWRYVSRRFSVSKWRQEKPQAGSTFWYFLNVDCDLLIYFKKMTVFVYIAIVSES